MKQQILKDTTNLKANGFELVPVSSKDVERLTLLIRNKAVRKYLFDGVILQKKQIEEMIASSKESFQQKNYGLWLIQNEMAQTALGFGGLWHFFDETEPQLVIALHPNFQNKGVATKTMQLLINFSLETLSFSYIDASCDAENSSSLRMLQRLGMEYMGDKTVDDKTIKYFRITGNSNLETQGDKTGVYIKQRR